ncbi:succinate dehydrogenase / fumarate reductase cytochrome b subunit [Saccharothrix ecbatanensis]|uniref:Succinate dehydrogenase / fumarate reductase cytochrome b subunit n=1 Tax=Saccharothrix ecbatanensis TaxID=1105145 RepID=A0A7W9HNC9_9PSEU|nr:succinate dehydrogenase cytochrome b subunit [Saccharothrix ecbatanensis]MBB5805474.1 succinate dehydrogenase / fumarate reductase cytochrome b subunit [Saccharothrix ecbatanensis]
MDTIGLYRTTIGKKAVMAVTGAALLLFIVAHMIGNLAVFSGAEAIDGYGRFLREIGVVWPMRIGLLGVIALHFLAAYQLTVKSRKARGKYEHRRRVQGSYAARTMRWGGVIIALFVVYHLLDLTVGWANPHGVPGEIYANVVADFQLWYVVLAYTVAVVALGFHIRHGLWSATQTLGITTSRVIGLGVAVLICAGFLSVPFAVFTGLVS